MKIAVVTRNFVYPSGGFEEHVYQLSRGLLRAGNDVKIFSTTLFAETLSNETLDVPLIRKPYKLKLFGYCYSPRLFEVILETKPDLVHAQGWGNHAIDGSLTVSRRLGTPFIVTPHGFFHEKQSNRLPKFLYNEMLSRRILAQARFIAISSHHAKYLRGRGAKTVSVIPNGIEPAEFSQKWTEFVSSDMRGTNFKVLVVGRLAPYKRFDTAIRAFAVLLKNDPRAQLVVVGEDWGSEGSLRWLAKSLGIAKSVIFTGRIDRKILLGIYQSCNVFVSTSSYEGFGIALLEALASGLPVVSTPVGAAPDLTRHLLMFPIGDWTRLGEILIGIRTGSNDMVEIAKLGTQEIIADYSWDRIVARTQRVYEEALSAKVP